MEPDLLDKIQDTEKQISDKKKETVELEKKGAEINELINKHQSAISNLQERKYRLGKEQYRNDDVRSRLVEFGLYSDDAELTDFSIIAKSADFSNPNTIEIDAYIALDKASRGKEGTITKPTSKMEKVNLNDEKGSAESKENVAFMFGQDIQQEGLSSMTPSTVNNEQKRKKVFISHASKDVSAVKNIVDLLELLGFGNENLFCSSIEPYGIPIGTDIYDYLKTQFSEYDLHVIFVLSKNYYDSTACLNEMGAAWVLSCSKTVMLLPEFDFREIDGAINPREIAIRFKPGMSDNDLYNLKSRVKSFIKEMTQLLGEDRNPQHIREERRDDFITKMNSYRDTTS